jgi:hypothetical protein
MTYFFQIRTKVVEHLRSRLPKLCLIILKMSRISKQEAEGKNGCKADLYDNCRRNGCVLPSFNSALCNMDFLIGTKERKVWCPWAVKMIGYVCVKPPCINSLKASLINEFEKNLYKLNKAERKMGRVYLDYVREHDADVKYYVSVIGYITDGSHEIFAKDYLPPKRPQVAMPTANNEHGFYTGLPDSQRKCKRPRWKLNIDEKDRENYEMAKI